MFKITPYEAINSYEKLLNPGLPLVRDDVPPMSHREATCMALEGTIFNPYGQPFHDPFLNKGIQLTFGIPDYYEYDTSEEPWKKRWNGPRPILPEPAEDVWEDAQNEYELIRKLNLPGNIRARRKFTDVQRLLHDKLNFKEKNLLKLADFTTNENWAWICKQGMATAMGILRDCWARWFWWQR